MPPDSPAAILRSQSGVISREQALAAGLSQGQITRQLSSGRWQRLSQGVYLTADAALTWNAWAHAFVLAAGPGAFLIGESAATLRGLMPQRFPVTVAIPAHRRSEVSNPRLRLLRLDVAESERVTIDGLPTTSRRRTAVDVAHLVPVRDAQPVLDRMLVLEHIHLEELAVSIAGSRRQGSRQARALLASATDGAAAESERFARRLLEQAGITGWVGNHPIEVGGYVLKVDLALVHLRIGIEVKGWAFHSLSDRAAADDRRLIDLQLTDWIVIPVGWLALVSEPQTLVAAVRAAIALRRGQAA